MKHAALTARYRPQSFAQVAGQDTIKTILSRASLENRVAPAYLFSGTRGVGKTTLARIFAKALNCRKGPTAEPCNECDQCRSITAGSAVDVVEIDGASNRGIDDVRRLKEVVGYAPMEGRYKIFIIDEAHMLSREAFNALLKTLEEPPAGVTFVMATTEPHKFPATIISRCQHFVFKRLSDAELTAHLQNVLNQEAVPFDEGAIRLIVRRGAGSVRDSMSLLGQVLALGEGSLSEKSVREVLGLAGQEAFMTLLEAVLDGDALAISKLLRSLLDQGLDMGFFLRELGSLWRSLFMLRQSGEAAFPVVELPENEARTCLSLAQNFTLPHIHACWQMTLEGQRRVLTSLEPALALELLLLNLAMLPKLLSLENLSSISRKGGAPSQGAQATAPRPLGDKPTAPTIASSHSASDAPVADPAVASTQETDASAVIPDSVDTLPSASGPDDETEKKTEKNAPELDSSPINGPDEKPVSSQKAPLKTSAPSIPDTVATIYGATSPAVPTIDPSIDVDEPEEDDDEYSESDIQATIASLGGPESLNALPDIPELPEVEESPQSDEEGQPLALDSLFALCAERETPVWLTSLLHRVEAKDCGTKLELLASDDFTALRLKEPKTREVLDPLFESWCGSKEISILAKKTTRKTREQLQSELMEHPMVKTVQESLGARMLDFGQMLR